MPPFSSILADIDALAPRHPALRQALDLAGRCHARVKVVDVLPHVPPRARGFVTEAIERELIAHRQSELDAIEAPPGVQLSRAVLRGRPADALIHEVRAEGHDLLIRAHVRDLSVEPRPFGAIDMSLLRQCPCPVWLVGPGGGRHPRKILAAINANPDDEGEQRLNTRILELALTLADVESARLTVLQAWEAFGESTLRGRMSDEELARFREEARTLASEDLSAFVGTFGARLGGAVLALEAGQPEEVVPAYAESHHVDVVVMGTVARTGVAGLLMGNTAERVLQRLRGSVLAIKPEGFDASPATS